MGTTVLRSRSAPRARALVSVVIPCHNYGRFLRECVGSVLSQAGVELDVLVLDDGSTDDTVSVGKRLAAEDSRVRFVSRPQRGQIPTINEGFTDAPGEYLVKLDADDMLTPGSLARSVALLEANTTVGFVYGLPLTFTTTPSPARTHVLSWSVWDGREWLKRRCSTGRNCIFQPEVVMRASALREVGQYRDDLPHTFDFEMWLRLAGISDVGRIRGPHQGWMRLHAASMQHTIHAGRLNDLRGRRAAFESALTGTPTTLPEAAGLETTARKSLATEALRAACSAHDRARENPAPRRGAPTTWIEEPAEDYVAFALDVFPEARALPAWRSLERRRASGHGYRNMLDHTRWNVQEYMRWRRWRWAGV